MGLGNRWKQNWWMSSRHFCLDLIFVGNMRGNYGILLPLQHPLSSDFSLRLLPYEQNSDL